MTQGTAREAPTGKAAKGEKKPRRIGGAGGEARGTGDARRAAGHAPREGGKGASGPASTPAEGLFGKADQIGSILAKGLDLAEAGVSLGLNLVNRLGALAQDAIINRLAAPLGAGAGAVAQQRTEAAVDAVEASRASAAAQDQGGESYIANRLPAFAGYPARVTFSINNDASDAPKHVRLSVEGFAGRRSGATLDARHLVVEPAVTTIEPMDFEKFTLSGTLPRDLPPDEYDGRILVASDETIGIPVRLLVSESMKR
ncbi:MAG: hypothetical protein EHM91_17190 [Planctomycetota bacterium]|nr:MAG: hypothetical protein EHM91_17190 [Planctomycetota bacterium]